MRARQTMGVALALGLALTSGACLSTPTGAQDGGSDATLGDGGASPTAAAGDSSAADSTPDGTDGQAEDAPRRDGGGDGSESGMSPTERCVFHTADLPTCKDCCDCAPLGCTELTPCRNACKDHDFSTNTGLVDVRVTPGTGQGGDYSVCVRSNPTAQTCKVCCECQQGYACGDFKYCRTLCDNSY